MFGSDNLWKAVELSSRKCFKDAEINKESIHLMMIEKELKTWKRISSIKLEQEAEFYVIMIDRYWGN